MSSIQGAKAISAVSRGDVREIKHARVFEVPSSDRSKLYTVVLHARSTAVRESNPHICNCEAGVHGRACWHIAAAKLLLAKERNEAEVAAR
jgi:hypothetical protein